ncbi:LpxL/LpxP family Kdo(2)-lipid IV(A) lauroyl/palmitoleoyl acyltransferase [Ferrimonas senticii]|uniref:LpxL/LpxP family Kdo(2)-lipid IV(A) lauroyl/palmitoleoyl acyltransferase n=1 Tax=Ferrimonas senticii TaxID=394566 RepID=UPI00041F02F9|nr:LpxL/LpxP family Kdo(2)-lipid IV(A) lauroyl/palmitoleoyl acyltransferase [Ferrimonas senticii]
MNQSIEFQPQFLAPKYWPIWLGLGLFRLLSLLPLSLQTKIGAGIGRLLRALLPKRVHTVQRNIERCLPELSAAEQQQLLHANFAEVGMAVFDTCNAWYWSDARIQRHMTVEGFEYIEQLQQQGHGVILLAAHCLMLEPGARIFGQRCQGVGVYRPNKNPLLEFLQVRGRLRSNKGLIPKTDVRAMVKALRQGEVIWYTQDQDAGDRGIFADFFGIPCSTAPGAPALARLGKAKVVPFFVERKADNSGYRIQIQAPLEQFPSGDEQADVQRGNDVTEQLVRMRPEQYMWLHQRFKTCAKGGERRSFYQ